MFIIIDYVPYQQFLYRYACLFAVEAKRNKERSCLEAFIGEVYNNAVKT